MLSFDIARVSESAGAVASGKVQQYIRGALEIYNKDNPGSSTRIQRLILMSAPPAIDANEITDKGYINQRAVLENRADHVARLYAVGPDEGVILL